MYCLKTCKLRRYNAVHNEGECYEKAPDCRRRLEDLDRDKDNNNEVGNDTTDLSPQIPDD